jgi:hypothetical protein
MAIYPILEDNVEFHTIETFPSRSYSSRYRRDSNGSLIYYTGSNGNLEEVLDNTGSVYVYTQRSNVEKEAYDLQSSTYIGFKDTTLESLRRDIVINTSTNKQSLIQKYMDDVYASTSSLRKQKKQEIIRFRPTTKFTSNTLRKTTITDHLLEYYRPCNTAANFNFTNYNSLNFFLGSATHSTSHTIPSSSVLLYPNPQGTSLGNGLYDSQYGKRASGSITFDFWIKPNYTCGDGEDFKAGTIFHLTGAYAISLHSGSYKDQNGYVKKYKLSFQVDEGAGTLPSKVSNSSSNIFLSDDNILNYNTWHHVTIRHGGTEKNYSGSFIVDGENVGTFSYPYPNYGLYDTTGSKAPSVLCIGNFFEGVNILEDFFNTDAALRDGLIELSASPSDPDFSDFSFNHPLQAEVHDLKIYDKHLSLDEIEDLDTAGPQSLSKLKFYLPPFFTEESPYRQFVGTYGGVLVTPFFERDGTTTTPYNGELAFSVDGHYMNLENYVRDFVTGRYPRLWFLTGSSFEPPSSVEQTADYFLYSSGSHAGSNKRRLYTILPNDHGNWQPNFDLLAPMSGAQKGGRYSNDLGNLEIGNISLRNIVTGTFPTNGVSYTTTTSGSIVDLFLGAGPESGSLFESPGNDMTIYNRLRSGDSNQVVIFDISNLFYGNRIKPNTIILTDNNISGSDDKIKIILKDDGFGNLYRANSIGSAATWASVGNVFYDEGLILIKAPQLFYFGKEGFDISFKGIQNIYSTKFNCIARPLDLISSSNVSWSPDLQYDEELINEPDQRFVYITSVNIHDDNMNIIMKAKLAQPVPKKSGDKLLFKPELLY